MAWEMFLGNGSGNGLGIDSGKGLGNVLDNVSLNGFGNHLGKGLQKVLLIDINTASDYFGNYFGDNGLC